MRDIVSTRLLQLDPYKPGEQPKDRTYIKLNANENPFPPPKCVTDAVTRFLQNEAKQCALYPDPDSTKLREAIADMLNRQQKQNKNASFSWEKITPDMIFCGNGSDEVLSFVFFSFFNSDAPLVLPEHTYSFYPVYSHFYGIPLERISLRPDFSLDTDAMLDAANKAPSSPTIFANPNAPTGIALTQEALREMLQKAPKDKAFVVDEAYIDFADENVCALPLLAEFDNLIIVRTFSKSFSFAGMRLGFVVANPPVIAALTTAKNSFNHFPVDVLTQQAGIAACSEESCSQYRMNTQKIIEEREDFSRFLSNKNWQVLPSSANFVFAKHPSVAGSAIYESLKKNGILVRRFESLPDFLRITIGTHDQMSSLKDALQNF